MAVILPGATAFCRRCGANLDSSYRTEVVTAEHHRVQVDQEGVRLGPSLLRATSACSWNCLAVLAAIEAGPDADAAVQVVAERERQVTAEGYSPEHDEAHAAGELAAAGVCYVASAVRQLASDHPRAVAVSEGPPMVRVVADGDVDLVAWPWEPEWWKPKTPERDLVRAGALVAAEADRLVRARRTAQSPW